MKQFQRYPKCKHIAINPRKTCPTCVTVKLLEKLVKSAGDKDKKLAEACKSLANTFRKGGIEVTDKDHGLSLVEWEKFFKDHPRIAKLKVKINVAGGRPYIDRPSLVKRVAQNGWTKRFNKFFGVQTSSTHGLFPHDVEAVLERISSGKLRGSQREWD